MGSLSPKRVVAALRAAGEPTRIRILALLAEGERSVKDLTEILGQSQPRISRHLKLLSDAGLVRRHREGGWAFFRLAEEGADAEIVGNIVARLDRSDPVLARDRERLEAVRRAHSEASAEYFRRQAARWDQIRSLHVRDDRIEDAILELVGEDGLGTLIDLGTGTGRMLELLSRRVRRGIGIDNSPDMLGYARGRLERAGLSNCQVRLGDIYNLPLQDQAADTVLVHQVLHHLEDPDRAVGEAARLLRPGGRLLIVDFAPHGLEYLRHEHAHRRLGFSADQVAGWLDAAGLDLAEHIDLAPGHADAAEIGLLTVSIWLARRRAEAQSDTTQSAEAA